MALITSLFNSAVWTSFTKGSCVLKGDSKLKQVGPIVASLPEVIFLLEQSNTASGTWYLANNLAKVLFSTLS